MKEVFNTTVLHYSNRRKALPSEKNFHSFPPIVAACNVVPFGEFLLSKLVLFKEMLVMSQER